jgi:hypothetical protein
MDGLVEAMDGRTKVVMNMQMPPPAAAVRSGEHVHIS